MERDVCQLKVTLRGTRPPVWLLLLVPSETTLTRLRRVLQIAIGWQDSHIQEFRIDGRHSARMQHSTRIGGMLTEIGSSLTYTYDLGDGWEHSVVLEKRLPGGNDAEYPVCLDGQLACPPEDCGAWPSAFSRLLRQHRQDRWREE